MTGALRVALQNKKSMFSLPSRVEGQPKVCAGFVSKKSPFRTTIFVLATQIVRNPEKKTRNTGLFCRSTIGQNIVRYICASKP